MCDDVCCYGNRVSHDRGVCFVRKTLDTAEVFELSRGLLIDPSAASLYGFVMGVEGTAEDDEWRVITIYFKSLLKRQCGCGRWVWSFSLILMYLIFMYR